MWRQRHLAVWKMPRTHRDRYIGTNIEIQIKTFYELKSYLKICWFVVTQPGLQEICRSKKFFDACSWKKIFGHKYIILAMLTLEDKVNLLFFLPHHFLVVRIVLVFLTHCPLCRFHYTVLQLAIQIKGWKVSAAASRFSNVNWALRNVKKTSFE